MTFRSAAAEAAAVVEVTLGYKFQDRELLRTAFLHRSYSGEDGNGEEPYERLEFLGDAVLQLVVTEYLYHAYPRMSEGEMAKTRAAVVDAATLAGVASDLDIGPALLLGRGEQQTGGREKQSILADVIEALIGAVFVEAGYEKVRELVRRHWIDLVDRRATAPGIKDYKTRLQEHLAREGLRPHYVLRDTGPEHAKEFTAEVWASDQLLGTGRGTSKKRAEQDAARDAADSTSTDA